MKNNTDFNATSLIVLLYSRRKIIIIMTLVAVLCSIVFSAPFFITPKYTSAVIMFPTSTNAISKALLSTTSGIKEDISEFGDEEQAEQLLQILNSSEIRDKIIWKYNLMEHYNIDTASRYKMTKLIREFKGNIKFRRTEFMALEISVMDKDPQMAADIANDIAALLDSTKNRMIKERAIKAYQIVGEEYHFLENQIREMEDSLTVLRKLGVYDYESQSERLNEQLAIQLAKNNMRGAKEIQKKLDILALYGGAYVSISDALEYEKEKLSDIKAKYEEAKVDAQNELPHKFIVDRAYKAEKKSYPKRWMIVVVSTIATFLLSIVVIIFFESVRNFIAVQKQNK